MKIKIDELIQILEAMEDDKMSNESFLSNIHYLEKSSMIEKEIKERKRITCFRLLPDGHSLLALTRASIKKTADSTEMFIGEALKDAFILLGLSGIREIMIKNLLDNK